MLRRNTLLLCVLLVSVVVMIPFDQLNRTWNLRAQFSVAAVDVYRRHSRAWWRRYRARCGDDRRCWLGVARMRADAGTRNGRCTSPCRTRRSETMLRFRRP